MTSLPDCDALLREVVERFEAVEGAKVDLVVAHREVGYEILPAPAARTKRSAPPPPVSISFPAPPSILSLQVARSKYHYRRALRASRFRCRRIACPRSRRRSGDHCRRRQKPNRQPMCCRRGHGIISVAHLDVAAVVMVAREIECTGTNKPKRELRVADENRVS